VANEFTGLDTRLAKAFSHPLRQRLLMAYSGRVLSPSQAAAELDAPLGDVSYHTKQLVAHGCVELVEAVRGRGGVKHFYRATVPYEVADREWSALSPESRSRLVEPIVGAIADDIAAAAAGGALAAEDVHVSRTPLQLDDQGRRELGALLERMVAEALRIHEESAARGGEAARILAILEFERPRR
jgi:hypothetical protein